MRVILEGGPADGRVFPNEDGTTTHLMNVPVPIDGGFRSAWYEPDRFDWQDETWYFRAEGSVPDA